MFLIMWPNAPFCYKRSGAGWTHLRAEAHEYRTERKATRVANWWKNTRSPGSRIVVIKAGKIK